MAGVLRIRGTIDLAQFWPAGTSDADTSKVKVTVGRNAFSFASNGTTFKVTSVLEKAQVVGMKKGPVIDSKSRITVRLQGIDAPELHYRASPLKKRAEVTDKKRKAYNEENRHERRQYWAETATVALAKKLSAYGLASVKCEVYSFVDYPHELVDTYGRVVGNIRVGKRFAVDVNTWLTEQGWVYPTFYSSMSEDEISELLAAAKKGRTYGRVWKGLTDDTTKWKPTLVYRAGGPIDEARDRGPVLMPKLFRRQVAHRMEMHAKVFSGTFADFLEARPDECHLTEEFLAQGPTVAPTYRLHEFMKGKRFALFPQDVVFREKFSTVVNAAGNRIEKF